MRSLKRLFLLPALLSSACADRTPLPAVVANDNRTPAGTRHADTVVLKLEAKLAAWRPDLDVDSTATVQVFSEEGGAPRIPGPLVRATEGTEIVVSVRNSLDSTVVVHGLRGGTVADDTLSIAPDSLREIRYRATKQGTYLYWGTTTAAPALDDRPWRDSQLTGAIVIDPKDTPPDTAERIFVITVLDVYPDDSVHNKKKEDIWELAINGLSWPHSERIEVPVGKAARWRWLNGSYLPHPMHLHGFHFRVLARGLGRDQQSYAPDAQQMEVTEYMQAGSVFVMEWTPTRAGTWLMHCHILDHIVPFPERPDSVMAHGDHDVTRHPMSAMSGLVLGVTSIDRGDYVPSNDAPTHRVRILAQETVAKDSSPSTHSFVLQRGSDPRRDSVEVPGAPIVLTRGERSMITVVNRLTRPTTVHWHGMELESVYDGVSGWSRTGSSIAPLIAPGDSFAVRITPPRAGTYIYHTHIDEGPQLPTGMYGPLLVLEPGQHFDAERDLVFVIGGAVVNDSVTAVLNGRREHAIREVKRGTSYRLRFINILTADGVSVRLASDSVPLRWRAVAKDGADLPPAMRVEGASELKEFGVGQTYDFVWTPVRSGEASVEVRVDKTLLSQAFLVR